MFEAQIVFDQGVQFREAWYEGVFNTLDEAVKFLIRWSDGRPSNRAWINGYEVRARRGAVTDMRGLQLVESKLQKQSSDEATLDIIGDAVKHRGSV